MDAILKAIGAVIRAGLEPPAIWLGLAGLVAVIAVRTLPPLAFFAAAWPGAALITLAAWLAMAATQVDAAVYRRLGYSLAGHDPYLIRALERRDALAAELAHLTLPTMREDVSTMLRRIDQELLPELATRIERHRTLTGGLAQLEHGQGPLVGASPENIAALRQLADQQRRAIEGLLSRLSDLNANLIGLTQESDQSQLAEQAREWVDDLGAYWQAMAEVFRSADLPSAPDHTRLPSSHREGGSGRS